MIWCEYAWLGGDEPARGVRIVIDGDRIARVDAGVAAVDGDERLPGLTLPGLANAHSHAFQRALRGRAHGRGSFWTWREQMYELAATIDPERMYRLARAVYGEMALAGITVVGEFHYLHHDVDGRPYADRNAMGRAVAAAAEEAGLRMTLLDACYLRGGFGRGVEGAQRRFADADAEAWAQRVSGLTEGPAFRVGAAIHSVRAVDPESARTVAEAAQGRALHAHVSEQPVENEECMAAHGTTPIALLTEAGSVSDRFTAVHATHLSDDDVLALAGSTVCLCPTTERDLADGVGPARRLREAGTHLALGSDSHALIDHFEEARAVELDERLATGERGHHTPADLLTAATSGGYRSLAWDGGELKPRNFADVVNVSLDSVRLAGAKDILGSLVFAGSAADVRHVMVGGRWIVRDGAHVSMDVARELAEAIA